MIKNPGKMMLGLTWVGWLNVLFLQWFFCRLSYGDRWRMLLGIIPLTGWWSDYQRVL